MSPAMIDKQTSRRHNRGNGMLQSPTAKEALHDLSKLWRRLPPGGGL